MIESLVECCVETSVTIATEAMLEAFEREALKRMKQGPKEGDQDDPRVQWLVSRFPNSTIHFPPMDDLTTNDGQRLDVFYLVLPDGIHRITANRTPTKYQPHFFVVDGVPVIFRKGGKYKLVNYCHSQELLDLYHPDFSTSECLGTTFAHVEIGEQSVDLTGDEESIWTIMCCVLAWYSPIRSYRMYINGKGVLEPYKPLVKEVSCWRWIFPYVLLFPFWLLWFLVQFFVSCGLCLWCCVCKGKGSTSRYLIRPEGDHYTMECLRDRQIDASTPLLATRPSPIDVTQPDVVDV